MRAVSKKRMQLLTTVQLVNEQRVEDERWKGAREAARGQARQVGAVPELGAPYPDPHYPLFLTRRHPRTPAVPAFERPAWCQAIPMDDTMAACVACSYIWGSENPGPAGCVGKKGYNPVPQPDPETRGRVNWYDWLIVGSVVVLVLVIVGKVVLK